MNEKEITDHKAEEHPIDTAQKPSAARQIKGSKKVRKKTSKKIGASSAKRSMKPKRPFPTVTLEEALKIPLKIKELNGGNP